MMPYAAMTPRARLSHKLRDGKYRARKMGCYYEHVSVEDASYLLAQTDCYYCHREIGPDEIWTLEHKTPLKIGGPHILENLAKACTECNESKAIQTELEYLARLDLRSFT